MPPENMAINMRHTKLKAEEAALLAGELNKPSWESRNEGIHERVSFEDAIWGFDLAGGAYYKTPLRVVGVKPGSRAEKAGIRKGDRLKRINDIDTSTLTIQEAHQIIIDSGIHLKIAVTAPEDEEDAYYCYEDPIEKGYDSDEERRLEEEKAKKREVHAKVSSYWSLQWPWVSKRRIIYRESNCFMVPSKYEEHHKDRFSPLPAVRTESDIVLDSIKSKNETKTQKDSTDQKSLDHPVNGDSNPPKDFHKPLLNGDTGKTNNVVVNGNGNPNEIPETEEELTEEIPDEEMNSFKEDVSNDLSHIEESIESEKENYLNDSLVNESNLEDSEITDSKDNKESEEFSHEEPAPSQSGTEESHHENDVIDEVLNTEDEVSKVEEENIIDSILSDHEEMNSYSDER